MIRHNGVTVYRQYSTIIHRGNKKVFRPWGYGSRSWRIAFKLWEALILKEHSRDELFERLYKDDPTGGPDVGTKYLDIRLCQFRNEFARMELQWVSQKRSGANYWQLIPTFSINETANRILQHVV